MREESFLSKFHHIWLTRLHSTISLIVAMMDLWWEQFALYIGLQLCFHPPPCDSQRLFLLGINLSWIIDPGYRRHNTRKWITRKEIILWRGPSRSHGLQLVKHAAVIHKGQKTSWHAAMLASAQRDWVIGDGKTLCNVFYKEYISTRGTKQWRSNPYPESSQSREFMQAMPVASYKVRLEDSPV